jgi:hypothetical protein
MDGPAWQLFAEAPLAISDRRSTGRQIVDLHLSQEARGQNARGQKARGQKARTSGPGPGGQPAGGAGSGFKPASY